MIRLPVPPRLSGVYHIIRDGEIIYIGQTANIFSRLATWQTGKFALEHFDRVDFHPLPLTELNQVEEDHLRRYRPLLNVEGVTKPFRPPRRWTDAPRCWYERRGVSLVLKRGEA